jgi:hypothetical protein
MGPEQSSVGQVLLVLCGIPLVWMLVLAIYSGNWQELAKIYKAKSPPTDHLWKFRDLWLLHPYRFPTMFSMAIHVGASSEGLSLSPFILFRFRHPSLLIPWNDITPQARKVFVFNYVRLEIKHVPRVKILLGPRLWQDILRTEAWRARQRA